MNEIDELKTDNEKITSVLYETKAEQTELNNHAKSLRSKIDKTNDLLTVIKNWIMVFGILTILGIASGIIYVIYLFSLVQ